MNVTAYVTRDNIRTSRVSHRTPTRPDPTRPIKSYVPAHTCVSQTLPPSLRSVAFDNPCRTTCQRLTNSSRIGNHRPRAQRKANR